jgi:hypothetical protein
LEPLAIEDPEADEEEGGEGGGGKELKGPGKGTNSVLFPLLKE